MQANVKKSSINRLKRIGGQIKGLEKMINDERYCIEIILQSLAVKKALSSFEDVVLENHLATHAADQMRSNKKSKAVKEIISIYKLSRQK